MCEISEFPVVLIVFVVYVVNPIKQLKASSYYHMSYGTIHSIAG